MMPQTLLSLVNKTAGGDPEAFEKLIVSQNSFILWIIHGMTNCPEDAEDICQEVSVRIFQHISSLKKPETFIAWLRTLVVHECKRYFAARKFYVSCVSIETLFEPENLFIDTDVDGSPSMYMEWLELKTAIEFALESLPESIRSIIYMRYSEDMRCCDIAASTGMKKGTLCVTLFRAKKHLRKKLRRRGISTI